MAAVAVLLALYSVTVWVSGTADLGARGLRRQRRRGRSCRPISRSRCWPPSVSGACGRSRSRQSLTSHATVASDRGRCGDGHTSPTGIAVLATIVWGVGHRAWPGDQLAFIDRSAIRPCAGATPSPSSWSVRERSWRSRSPGSRSAASGIDRVEPLPGHGRARDHRRRSSGAPRLGDLNMGHLFFGGIAVFATPVAAVAVWSIWRRLRAGGHVRAGRRRAGVLRRPAGGRPRHRHPPAAGLRSWQLLRGASRDAGRDQEPAAWRQAGVCLPAIRRGCILGSATRQLDAHTGRRVVPMCFQAETYPRPVRSAALAGCCEPAVRVGSASACSIRIQRRSHLRGRARFLKDNGDRLHLHGREASELLGPRRGPDRAGQSRSFACHEDVSALQSDQDHHGPQRTGGCPWDGFRRSSLSSPSR